MAKAKQAADVSKIVFTGDSEMAERCRDFDWASTSLGPVEGWSHALRTTVSMVLESRNPMLVFWGDDLVQIYNDAFRPSLGSGDRDARGLGAKAREFWADAWVAIGTQVEGVVAHGESVWFEDAYVPIERDGALQDVWWTYGYSPLRDDDGSLAGVLVVCQETTGRVKAERRLNEVNGELELARAQLAQAFAKAPSFFAALHGPDHRFVMANEAYYGLIGGRDIIGKTLHEALPEVAEQGFNEILDQVLTTGVPYVGREVPVTLVRSRGSPPEQRFVDFVYQATTDVDGSRTGVLVHGYDVSDHVAARDALAALEAEFRTVLDASPDASLLARAVRDADGRIADFVFSYANAASRTILLAADEVVVGRTMREAFPESVAAGRLDRYAEVVETGRMWMEDVRYTRGAISHGLRVTAVKVGDGVHIGAIDLSERMRAAEERERLLAAAEAANRAKSEFLAVMSHELRTPLNAIDGYAELLELGVHGPLNESQGQDVSRIRKSQRHLLGLINGVLNYTRVEAGVARYDLAAISIADILASCETLMQPQMNTKGLTFRVEMCPATILVSADAEKLQQILLNLLTNALKFTAAGGTVKLSSDATDETVRVRVEDTGRGIPPEQVERIFEPFVQIDAGLTRTEHGVGLGLAISRDLARGMSGEITVVSEVGKGSIFTVRLPRVRARRD